MPRDGSGIYSTPPGTDGGPPGVTIASTPYNVNVHDVEADLNAARPIIAGGTGATSAAEALFNLKAETATQIVTNYDSHLWLPGSFRSAAGATGAPNGTSAFAGTVYIGEALANPPTNQNVVVEARDLDSVVKPGLLYTRQKTAGVWSAWNYAGTGDDQTAARSAIYAAPFDAMAYNGMQVNGSMEVSQELGLAGAVVTGLEKYVADGWLLTSVGPQIVSGGQVTSSLGPAGHASFLQCATGSGNPPTPAATSRVFISQRIEGYRVNRLGWGAAGASSISIGFWIWSHVSGTFSGAIINGASSRTYVFTFSVGSPGAWEYKTILVPGDTTGTWAKDNTIGMNFVITPLAGTSFQTAPNVWTSGVFLAATGTANALLASGDQFLVTGVVILPGTQAPAAAQSPLIMRPYDQELVTCQRYYQLTGMEASGFWRNTVSINVGWKYVTDMRASPTRSLNTTTPIFEEVGVALRTGAGSTILSSNGDHAGGRMVIDGFTGAAVGNFGGAVTRCIVADARL